MSSHKIQSSVWCCGVCVRVCAGRARVASDVITWANSVAARSKYLSGTGILLAPRASPRATVVPACACIEPAPAQHRRCSYLLMPISRDIIPDTSNYQIQASQSRLREPVSMRSFPPARYTIGEKLTYLVPAYKSGSGDDSGNSVFAAGCATGCHPPCRIASSLRSRAGCAGRGAWGVVILADPLSPTHRRIIDGRRSTSSWSYQLFFCTIFSVKS